MLSPKKMLLAKLAAAKLRPQDVFATSIYTGNGESQTITNGLDILGKGGLTWNRIRTQDAGHYLFDTARGSNSVLATNTSSAEGTGWAPDVNFLNNGVRFDNNTGSSAFNQSGHAYVNWTFLCAKGFLDIITYTGNGVAGRQIPHRLGTVPGMVSIKRRTGASNFETYHRAVGPARAIYLDSTSGASGDGVWNNTSPTDTAFTVGNGGGHNVSGQSYVAFVFAQNPDLIDCGSFVGNGSLDGPTVTCGSGWSPQFLMLKNIDEGGTAWPILDTARGLGSGNIERPINANTAFREPSPSEIMNLTATGFKLTTTAGNFNASANKYAYLAIRSPT